MKKSAKILIGVISIIVLAAGIFFLKNAMTNNTKSQESSPHLGEQQKDLVKEQQTENKSEQNTPHSDLPLSEKNQYAPRQLHREAVEILTESERATLPDCAAVLYTEPYVHPTKIREITPLGNVDPPGHTIPTNHLYNHLNLPRESIQTLPLYLPADAWITHITVAYGFTQDPEDDTIYFAVCKDVIGYFNHVKKLSPELQKMVDAYQCPDRSGTGSNCLIQILEPLPKGIYLGEVGRPQGNFDFGTIDLRTEHSFINKERYALRTLHIQCPFDYYGPELKAKYSALLQGDSKSCGKINYDILGTLQGNWFNGNSKEYYGGDWVKHTFFGYDNVNSERAVLSVGGVIVDEKEGLRWKFIPVNSGTINRKFEDVKSDGTLYCYDANNQDQFNIGPKGRILVQMENDKQIKVEHQSGSCTESLSFSGNAKMYER